MEEKRDTGGFNLSKLKCLTSSDLKLVALCTMTIDHIGAVLLPQYLILRIIGRIAFPIYCFLIVNGLFHTRDCKKYIGRLLLFALISEIFFDLAFFETIYEPEDQNVFFTLAIGLVMLYVIERIHKQPSIKIHFFKIVMELLVVILCCFLAYVLRTDYSFYGILMMYGFYMFQSNGFMSFIFEAYMNVVVMGYIQSFAVISMPIIWLYNGKAGSRKYKWLFYIYYPAHLLILFLLREFGGNYFV